MYRAAHGIVDGDGERRHTDGGDQLEEIAGGVERLKYFVASNSTVNLFSLRMLALQVLLAQRT